MVVVLSFLKVMISKASCQQDVYDGKLTTERE